MCHDRHTSAALVTVSSTHLRLNANLLPPCCRCRTVVHVGRQLPVSVVLKNLLERSFPEEYAIRRQEEEESAKAAASAADQVGHVPRALLRLVQLPMPGLVVGEIGCAGKLDIAGYCL